MKWTILGSGGCQVIPKPLCNCPVCAEARAKGVPYSRTGPSAFLSDIGLLVDTPAEVASQLNNNSIEQVRYLILTHLDPDHTEGFRVVEQIALDFRTWTAYPEKQVCLLVPHYLADRLHTLTSQYGSFAEFFLRRGFLSIEPFEESITIEGVKITAVPVDTGNQKSSVYVFTKGGKKLVYATCDIKPFPEYHPESQNPDILVIQPGIFEDGLKHGFVYPDEHISRKSHYTFPETLALAGRIGAKKTILVHLEEYWNRTYDQYREMETQYTKIAFAYDGMQILT
ncbi:MBL fold metallo-hydrolase [Chloroflexota bacterium]